MSAVTTHLHPVPFASVREITGEKLQSRKSFSGEQSDSERILCLCMVLPSCLFLAPKKKDAPRPPLIESRGPIRREGWYGSLWQQLVYVPLIQPALPSPQARTDLAPHWAQPRDGSSMQCSDTSKGSQPRGVPLVTTTVSEIKWELLFYIWVLYYETAYKNY